MRRNALQVLMLGLAVVMVTACVSDLAQRKRRAAVIRNVGEAHFQEGNYAFALREYLKSLEIYPDDHLAHDYLGLTYMAKERWDLAIQHFQTSIKLKPGYAPARNNLGVAYSKSRQWDKAIATFNEITSDLLYATPHLPLTNIGWAYFNKKQYNQAERYYREALKLQPRYAIALRGLGRTYLEMGKIEDAVHYLESAIYTDPRFYEAFFELAGAYTKLERPDLALAAFKRVVALAPPESDLARQSRIAITKLSPNNK